MTIYTIGYTGRTPEQILGILNEHDATLLDIRYNPRSRVPHWNKGPLSRTFGERYLHVPALGNVNYKGTVEEISIADLPAGTEALRRFHEQNRNVVLMCVCADVSTCHRKVVAEALAKAWGVGFCHLDHADPTAQSASGLFG
jgi:uncharacterized protein (DUF488 family)